MIDGEARTGTLLDARRSYGTDDVYDEALREVSRRILDSGSAGKVDIGALILWKRIQANTPWSGKLNVFSDDEIRAVTKRAFALANDKSVQVPDAAATAREALRSLPGFKTGFSLASALLLAAAPNRMAVYDRRANLGLTRLGLQYSQGAGYGGYMRIVERLRAEVSDAHGVKWIARDVDLALFMLGKRS